MKVITAILFCAMVPVFLIAAPGFVGGYLGGFGLDCRGTPPGLQSAIVSGLFTLVFTAPATIPMVAVGAIVGGFGIRRGRRALLRLLTITVVSGMMIGGIGGAVVMAMLTGTKDSANPIRLQVEAVSVCASGGGLLGLLVALGVVLVWRRRDNAASAEPGAAADGGGR